MASSSSASFTRGGISSNTQPSIHASRVTFAATLAAPTILNFESALGVTVKEMPGNRAERFASQTFGGPSASTYTCERESANPVRQLSRTHLRKLYAALQDLADEKNGGIFRLAVQIVWWSPEHTPRDSLWPGRGSAGPLVLKETRLT